MMVVSRPEEISPVKELGRIQHAACTIIIKAGQFTRTECFAQPTRKKITKRDYHVCKDIIREPE